MKIVQVIPFFAPAWSYGGPVRVCLNISTELAKRGHKVTVLTTDAYDHRKRTDRVCEESNSVSVRRFKNFNNSWAKKYNLFLPFEFKKYFTLNANQYDIVHLHAFFTYQNIIASKICRRFDIPYVLHLHESPVPKPILGKVLIKKIFNSLYGRKILSGASSIFTLTSAEKADLIMHYPNLLRNKVEIIFNGVEPKKINKVNKDELRAKYGYSAEDKIILSLSRLAKIKRIDLLIRALHQLRKHEKNFKLLIAGPDERGTEKLLIKLAQNLKISNYVKFIGAVSGKKKEEVYSLSDIYALFSDYESFSVTSLEALQNDLPLCLSNNVGLSKDLKKFAVGKVVDTGNLNNCAKALLETYNQKEKLLRNSYRALENFKNKNIVIDVEKIYRKIINQRST